MTEERKLELIAKYQKEYSQFMNEADMYIESEKYATSQYWKGRADMLIKVIEDLQVS